MNLMKLFITASLLQILIFNNFYFGGHINPFYYIVFIFSIPPSTNGSKQLILSFLIGLIIDLFTYAQGIHCFSTVLICYVKLLMERKKVDQENTKEIINSSWSHFVSLIVPLTVIHHFSIFFLEIFSTKEFITITYHTIFSSVFTLLFIAIHKIIRTK